MRAWSRPVAALVLVGVAGASPMAIPAGQAAVPAPPPGHALITVKVGGDRDPSGSVRGLAGVRLGLHTSGTGTVGAAQGAPGPRHDSAWSWTTCVSDADGDCTFMVPVREGAVSSTGVPQDSRFWVVQEAAPSGWYDSPRTRLGSPLSSPEYTWDYRFRTEARLRAGETYLSTAPLSADADWDDAAEPDRGFMRVREVDADEGSYAANIGRTTGVWRQSRVNPVLASRCDVSVAVAVDTSGSLGATGIAQMKETLDAFVDSFRGSAARMSIFSFSTTSPGAGASNHPTPLPVTTADEAEVVKAQYQGWTSVGGTNWDQGLAAVANSGHDHDLVVLLTDGNPSAMGPTPGPGTGRINSLQDVDAGVFSANQLKARGTRILAVGVGAGVVSTASAANLRAVSGTTEGVDYVRATDFSQAAEALGEVVPGSCEGSVAVRKMIVPAGGDRADAVPAPAGWRFDATSRTGDLDLVGPVSQTTTDAGGGVVDFDLVFASPGSVGRVEIRERQQDGYAILPVDGRNAVCEVDGDRVPVSDAGGPDDPGFVVAAAAGDEVSCTLYNVEVADEGPPGDLSVEKSASPASGTTVRSGDVVTYRLVFRNRGSTPLRIDHVDHLGDVLDDALVVAAPDVRGAGEGIRVSAIADGRFAVTGELAPRSTATVTYRVRIHATGAGNASVANFLTPSGEEPPDGGCARDAVTCTVHAVAAVGSGGGPGPGQGGWFMAEAGGSPASGGGLAAAGGPAGVPGWLWGALLASGLAVVLGRRGARA